MVKLNTTPTQIFFIWIVEHPKRIVAMGLILIMAMGSFIPQLTQDTRSDAFLADDNPALVYREKVKVMFGLSDPMVIAVVNNSAQGKNSIFTIDALNLVQVITNTITEVNNIDPDGITSLATENNIRGTEEGMEVDPFFDQPLSKQSEANLIRDAIRDFPLYQGSLVAKDESATLIVAELLDEGLAEQTYLDILAALNGLELPENIELHIAGEGAVSGYLGSYIAADAQRLNPIAALIITIIIFIAFLSLGATLMANVIIAAAVVTTVGAMSAFGVPFYVITNALPVILIGIAVADSIHIYSEYFERRAIYEDESINESIVAAMDVMWRPITLTSLTTIAGFLGLSLASYMPPFNFFGLFTALGVSMAWLFSMTFLPAAMSLLKTNVHPSLAKKMRSENHDTFARVMVLLGKFTQAQAKPIVIIAALVAVCGMLASSQLEVNEDRIETFNHDETIYIANSEINNRFDGTNYLDIVIETPAPEGLFDPLVLNKIAALQVFVETLPNVQGSTSIVDYLKQMNRALNGGDSSEYKLPASQEMVAQYFLLYSTSSDPTDFEEEVDYDYQMANLRVSLNVGAYIDNKQVIETLQVYLDTEFNDASVTATLSGRVNLTYHWIKDLGMSHFAGSGIALFLVWIVSALLFRSIAAGSLAVIPVATSILIVYSSMVIWSIPLGIGTSMFAAVAIGLGVDFAIHTIDRIRAIQKETGDITATLKLFYPSTGRALLFNLLAIALGFGVLISSKVVPLNNFGSIVAISVLTSFLVSMTLLPALILLFRPRFIVGTDQQQDLSGVAAGSLNLGIKSIITLVAVSSLLFVADNTTAESLPDGIWVMEQANAVNDGDRVSRKLTMKLVDRRGKVRLRETQAYRKYFGDEKRTVLFYTQPKNVKDTGFLTYDYPETDRDDDQWLYLPALRKARRISASDRGDYFLGTDLTYEDIKNEGKVELKDYQFTTLRKELIGTSEALLVKAIPVDKATAKELGYGQVYFWIDSANWIAVKTEFWDVKLNRLKTLITKDVRQVNGIWTRHHLEVTNHKTGHYTEFVFSDVDYQAPISDVIFTRQALKRGAPK